MHYQGFGLFFYLCFYGRQCQLSRCLYRHFNKSVCFNFCVCFVRVHIESGGCEVPLPPMLAPCSSGIALFNKTDCSARGTVGVFTYDLLNLAMNDCTQILTVMFSVPYDRNLYSNWFAVGIADRGRDCDSDLYNEMYEGNEYQFVRAKANGSCITYEGDFVTIRASMSDSAEAVLRVEVINSVAYGY